MFGQDRNALRRAFFEAWRKHHIGVTLEPLEQVIVQIAEQHPEYHRLLERPDDNLGRDYDEQANPFLHMAMHIALHEQLSTGRPNGIQEVYRELMRKFQDAHAVEHQMMDCLGEALWQTQRSGGAPDEAAYLECLKQRARP